MQPTNRSRRILLPVRMWYVYFSLFVALGLSYVPTGRTPGIPDWVALVLAFWCVREPRRVNMGTGFVFGLLVDIGHGAVLGQYALSYVVLAYMTSTLSRRILWFPLPLQALHLLPLLLLAQALMSVVRVLIGGEFPGWWIFFGSLTSAALWIPITYLLLLPQFQPLDRDDNRPI